MRRIYRVIGDQGSAARLSVTLEDLDGDPITSGTVTLRVGGLFEGSMTHEATGTWFYDPVAGDIDTAGEFWLEVSVNDVTLPSQEPHILHVRRRAEAPA